MTGYNHAAVRDYLRKERLVVIYHPEVNRLWLAEAAWELVMRLDQGWKVIGTL